MDREADRHDGERTLAGSKADMVTTAIAPLVTKITYIKMDPLNPIRNGFVNPSPMDSHFRVAWG